MHADFADLKMLKTKTAIIPEVNEVANTVRRARHVSQIRRPAPDPMPCLALFAAALLLRAGVPLQRLTQGWLSFEHDLFVAESSILSKISC